MKFILDYGNDLRVKVKSQAAQEKISMNDLITKAIELYLKSIKEEK